MGSVITRVVLRFGLIATLLLALPGAAWATVTGGCQVTGNSSSGGTIDLTTQDTWHLKSTDTAGGSGTAPSPQKTAQVAAYALGLGLPIASGNGDGSTSGSVDGVAVSTYAVLGARFTVAGSSDSCSGHVIVILDDVNPLLTVLGGGGIAAAVIGLLVLLAGARGAGGGGSRFVGLIFGFLGGCGLGLALEQFGVLDSTQPIGLVIGVVGAVLGLLLPGRLASRSAVA